MSSHRYFKLLRRVQGVADELQRLSSCAREYPLEQQLVHQMQELAFEHALDLITAVVMEAEAAHGDGDDDE